MGLRFVMAMPATRAEAVRREAIRASFMVASLTSGGRVESMKRSDKWVLGLSLGSVAVLLLGALSYATLENIKADRAQREQQQAEEKRLADETNKQRREAWKAYLQTPEGQAEMAKKREAEALKQAELRAAEAARQKAWQKASAKEDYTLSANEREDVLAIIVRLTNDPDATLVEISSAATQEHLECIVKFESRQKQRLWRMIMNRLNGDLWSVADRETGKMIWSLEDQ